MSAAQVGNAVQRSTPHPSLRRASAWQAVLLPTGEGTLASDGSVLSSPLPWGEGQDEGLLTALRDGQAVVLL